MLKTLIKRLATTLTAFVLMVTLGTTAFADATEETQAVLDHHMTAFGSGDIEAFLMDYTPDSVLMYPGGHSTGPDEIRPAITALMAEFAKPGMTFEMLHIYVSGRTAYIVWKAETADNIYEMGTDTFLIEDGKIVSQTFTPKKTTKN